MRYVKHSLCRQFAPSHPLLKCNVNLNNYVTDKFVTFVSQKDEFNNYFNWSCKNQICLLAIWKEKNLCSVLYTLSASCQNTISCCFLTSQDMSPKSQTRWRNTTLAHLTKRVCRQRQQPQNHHFRFDSDNVSSPYWFADRESQSLFDNLWVWSWTAAEQKWQKH